MIGTGILALYESDVGQLMLFAYTERKGEGGEGGERRRERDIEKER